MPTTESTNIDAIEIHIRPDLNKGEENIWTELRARLSRNYWIRSSSLVYDLLDTCIQGFFDVLLSTVLLHKHINHDGMSAPIRLPPILDGRGYFPSVWLHLELVVDRFLHRDLPVEVPADTKLQLIDVRSGKCRVAPADGGDGKLLPGVALNGAARSSLQSSQHLIFGQETTPR
jgi:hypothetical protein